MKNKCNEQGYSLLFTLGTLMLISILGLSLLMLSFTGATRNEGRQHTALATDLSEKGVQYLTNSINNDLQQAIPTVKFAPNKMEEVFANIFTKYSCASNRNVVIDGSSGETAVCIESISPNTITNNKNTRLFTIRSVGQTNGNKQAGSKTVLELGFSDIPEQLSYAVSSNDNGNIYLFGGVEIQGNIKLAGDMYVSNQAFHSYESTPEWVQSVYPKIKSHELNKAPIIYSDKTKIYRFTSMPNSLTLNNNNIYATNGYNRQFKNFTEEIQSIDLAKAFTDSKPVFRQYQGNAHPFLIHHKPSGYSHEKSKFEEMATLSNSYKVTYNGSFYKKEGSQSIKDNKIMHIKNGDMKIGSLATQNSSAYYTDVQLEGNYYVDGNVTIQGAKLKSNAVIYAKGDVLIAFSSIEPLNNGTLFIFADGNIKIQNISVDSWPGKGSIINGYFYTNKDFLMYGVGSNTTITGGLSARNIIYTAVRGNAVNKGEQKPYTIKPNCTAYASKSNCLNISSGANNSVITFDISPQQRTDTTTWIQALINKVENNYRGYRYVDSHKINNRNYISNDEFATLLNLLQKPNDVNLNNYELILKVRTLSNHIPDSLRTFSYTAQRFSTIKRTDLIQYRINTKRQSIQETLKKFYEYGAKKLLKECEEKKTSNCEKIQNEFYQFMPKDTPESTVDSIENQLAHQSRLTIVYDRELVTRYRKTTEDDLSAIQDLSIFKQKIHSFEPF